MIELINRSTQKNENSYAGKTLYFRSEDDMRRLVNFVVYGNIGFGSPIFVSGRGVCLYDGGKIYQSFIYIQNLYNKTSGMRIREQILLVSKDELHVELEFGEIIKIADVFSGYYFYKGFQCVYAVFDNGYEFSIVYAINTVSFRDGHKYSRNNYYVYEQEQNAANTAVNMVTGKPMKQSFTFGELEYYPEYFPVAVTYNNIYTGWCG